MKKRKKRIDQTEMDNKLVKYIQNGGNIQPKVRVRGKYRRCVVGDCFLSKI
jgi:hypothetical protein